MQMPVDCGTLSPAQYSKFAVSTGVNSFARASTDEQQPASLFPSCPRSAVDHDLPGCVALGPLFAPEEGGIFPVVGLGVDVFRSISRRSHRVGEGWPRLDATEGHSAGGSPCIWNAAVAAAGSGRSQLASAGVVLAQNVQGRTVDHPGAFRRGFRVWIRSAFASRRQLRRAQSAANDNHDGGPRLLLFCLFRTVAQKGLLGG